MKPIIFFLILLSSINCKAQDISYEISINGNAKQRILSRSKENFITIVGKGCEEFVLTGYGVTLEKVKGGYLATNSQTNSTAAISVTGVVNGKNIALGKTEYKIVE
jgi:hypothetical protein